jgi:hypothetical protein
MRHREGSPLPISRAGLPFQKLRNHVVRAVLLADVINGKPTRMIQGAQDTRFMLKLAQTLSRSKKFRSGFEGDNPIEERIVCVRHLAHAATRLAATGFRKGRVWCRGREAFVRAIIACASRRADETIMGERSAKRWLDQSFEVLVHLKRPRAKSWELRRCLGRSSQQVFTKVNADRDFDWCPSAHLSATVASSRGSPSGRSTTS